METTRLSSKGQVVIPKSIRESYQWLPGIELVVEEKEEGVLLCEKKPTPRASAKHLLGCTGYKGPRLSLKEMEEGIKKGALSRK
jgi:AbrB family looped-hinge helix DNA binding protein